MPECLYFECIERNARSITTDQDFSKDFFSGRWPWQTVVGNKRAGRGSGREWLKIQNVNRDDSAAGRSAGFDYFRIAILGFRCAPLQALCCSPLPPAGS